MDRKQTLKEYNQLRRETKQAEREILDLQRGIYNKPMAVEMQKEYALTAYINSEDAVSASVASGVPAKIIRKWIKAENWDAIKKDHYQKVRMKTLELLNKDVAEQKAKIGNSIAQLTMEALNIQVNNDEITLVEQSRAVKDLVDSYIKITGDVVEEEKKSTQIEGVSFETQQLFVNLLQDNRTVNASVESISDDDDEDIIEHLMELDDEDE